MTLKTLIYLFHFSFSKFGLENCLVLLNQSFRKFLKLEQLGSIIQILDSCLKMDKIPLQTLKVVDKVASEDQINELSCQFASIRRNFKPTVRTRREFEPSDEVDFDTEFEKEVNKVDKDVDEIYLKETLPKMEAELNLWVNEYKNLLKEYKKLHEDSPKDQVSPEKNQ